MPPQAVAESITRTRPAGLAELVRACSAERTVPDMPPARWIETISLPACEQRLVDRQEVTDRRL